MKRHEGAEYTVSQPHAFMPLLNYSLSPPSVSIMGPFLTHFILSAAHEWKYFIARHRRLQTDVEEAVRMMILALRNPSPFIVKAKE